MNILVMTSVYPDAENTSNENATKVVKYFAESWAGFGHDVYVIHNSHKYPTVIHKLPHSFKRIIASKIGFYIPDYSDVCKKKFEINGIKGMRLPILKLRPHRKVGSKQVKEQVKAILSQLDSINYIPDLIVCHWVCPQVQLLKGLRARWNDVRTAVVLHGSDYIYDKDFEMEIYLKDIDVLGCRSKTEAISVKKGLKLDTMPFVCYSGIPDAFVKNSAFHAEKFSDTSILRMCFVGRLVKYKNVDLLIRAISQCNEIPCRLDIVGEGAEKENLMQLAKELGVADSIVFHGRKTRSEVLDIMKQAHLFTMISKGEVFGLTYLEAMIASCIPIGSTGEGIDGVIENGKNGYLVTPDNESELVSQIKHAYAMSKDEMVALALSAYDTAVQFSDSKMAQLYLDNVLASN